MTISRVALALKHVLKLVLVFVVDYFLVLMVVYPVGHINVVTIVRRERTPLQLKIALEGGISVGYTGGM
jgi:uncharacterized membrane protein (Fun14 family)